MILPCYMMCLLPRSLRRGAAGSARRDRERSPEPFQNYTPPPPPPGSEESWELQFCKWWGWNWVRKENLEVTKFELLHPGTCNCYSPTRSFPPSSRRQQSLIPKRRAPERTNHIRDLCNCLFATNRQRTSESLQRLYSTPSNSVIYQQIASNRDRGMESYSCLEFQKNFSNRVRKECRCRQRTREKSRCRCAPISQERECKCSEPINICKCKERIRQESSTSITSEEDRCTCYPQRKPTYHDMCKCRRSKSSKRSKTNKIDRPSQTNPALVATHAQTTKSLNKGIKKCECVHLVCHCCCCCCCCKKNSSNKNSTTSTADLTVPDPDKLSNGKCPCCSNQSGTAPCQNKPTSNGRRSKTETANVPEEIETNASEKVISVCDDFGKELSQPYQSLADQEAVNSYQSSDLKKCKCYICSKPQPYLTSPLKYLQVAPCQKLEDELKEKTTLGNGWIKQNQLELTSQQNQQLENLQSNQTSSHSNTSTQKPTNQNRSDEINLKSCVQNYSIPLPCQSNHQEKQPSQESAKIEKIRRQNNSPCQAMHYIKDYPPYQDACCKKVISQSKNEHCLPCVSNFQPKDYPFYQDKIRNQNIPILTSQPNIKHDYLNYQDSIHISKSSDQRPCQPKSQSKDYLFNQNLKLVELSDKPKAQTEGKIYPSNENTPIYDKSPDRNQKCSTCLQSKKCPTCQEIECLVHHSEHPHQGTSFEEPNLKESFIRNCLPCTANNQDTNNMQYTEGPFNPVRPSYRRNTHCKCCPTCPNEQCVNRFNIDEPNHQSVTDTFCNTFYTEVPRKQNLSPYSIFDYPSCHLKCPDHQATLNQRKFSYHYLGDCKCAPYLNPSTSLYVSNCQTVNKDPVCLKSKNSPCSLNSDKLGHNPHFDTQKIFSKFGVPSQKYPWIHTTKSDIFDKYYSIKLNEDFFSPVSGKVYDLSTQTPSSLDDYKCCSLPDPIEVEDDIKYLENLDEKAKKEMKSRIMLDVVCDTILFRNTGGSFETESTVNSKYSSSRVFDTKLAQATHSNTVQIKEENGGDFSDGIAYNSNTIYLPLSFEKQFLDKVEDLVKKLLKKSNVEEADSHKSDSESNFRINLVKESPKYPKRIGSPVLTHSTKKLKSSENICQSSDENLNAQVSNFNNLFEKMDELTMKSRVNVAKIQGVIKSLPQPDLNFKRKMTIGNSNKKPISMNNYKTNKSEILETLHEAVMNTNIDETIVQNMFDIISNRDTEGNTEANLNTVSNNSEKMQDENESDDWSSLSSECKTKKQNSEIKFEIKKILNENEKTKINKIEKIPRKKKSFMATKKPFQK